MDLQVFQQTYSLVGTTGFLLFIIWMLLKEFVFSKPKDKQDRMNSADLYDLKDKVALLEGNHIKHIEDDMESLKKKCEVIGDKLDDHSDRLARIETKLEK